MQALIRAHFDADTGTLSYLLADPEGPACAVIDPVLDFDPASGRTATRSADVLIDWIEAEGRRLEWILETHAHADHLSAAPYLRRRLGGRIGIGARITEVQSVFREVFNLEPGFPSDGSQFDALFDDGARFALGGLTLEVLHTPGHTPACVSYRVGDAVFVGDTLFMPDGGTARCDFPGGDAATLYRSIRRLLDLPPETRVFVCHDYQPGGRDLAWEASVAEQRAANIHVRDGLGEADFVAMRQARDATLAMPRLLLPSVQVNIRAGSLPPPEDNGVRYLKLPIDRL